MARNPLLGAAIGKKGIGKTWLTLQMIYRYVNGSVELGIKGRKFLILDVNDEFKTIKAIAHKDIRQFAFQQRAEVRRVRIFKDDGSGKMTLDEIAVLLNEILEIYNGGGLLIEDLSKYVGDHYSKDLIGAICTQRHMDCDIILHFQTVGKIAHPKIWGNLNYVRFHKTTDNVERHKNKFGGEVEHLKICETMVNQQYRNGNTRFCCYLDLDKGKIKGAFKKEDFQNAINDYISDNQKETIKPMLDKIDLKSGKRLYTYEQGLIEIQSRLFNDYYGNAA